MAEVFYFSPFDMRLLYRDAPQGEPRATRPLLGTRSRTAEEQDFWLGQAYDRDAVQGPLTVGREHPYLPYSLGHYWIWPDSDMFFVGLRRSPVFYTLADGFSWLSDHPQGAFPSTPEVSNDAA